jgi:hypothetical protein
VQIEYQSFDSHCHRSDQAHTHRTIALNHDALVETLDNFHLKLEQRMLNAGVAVAGTDQAVDDSLNDVDPQAIESLADCMRMAEDLHEVYTTEYAPDARSELFHRDAIRDEQSDTGSPPPGTYTPRIKWPHETAILPFPATDTVEDTGGRKRTWPLPYLNDWIESARMQAMTEQKQGHYNTAEKHLYSTIKYSEMRQKHYDVPFTDAVQLQEQVAQLYQQQGKYGEALAHIHGLLREESEESAQARQHQILAAIYLEKYQKRRSLGSPCALPRRALAIFDKCICSPTQQILTEKRTIRRISRRLSGTHSRLSVLVMSR